jgi:hypothetical protein
MIAVPQGLGNVLVIAAFPAQVGCVERRTEGAGESGWHMDGTRPIRLGENAL